MAANKMKKRPKMKPKIPTGLLGGQRALLVLCLSMVRLRRDVLIIGIAGIAFALACSPEKSKEPVKAVPAAEVVTNPSRGDELSELRLTEMCAAGARQFWKDGGYDKKSPGQIWGFYSHYNHRLRRCLIQTRLTNLAAKEVSTQDFVSDAFEGIDIATGSNVDRQDAHVVGDDVLSGLSEQVPHTREWFKKLMVE